MVRFELMMRLSQGTFWCHYNIINYDSDCNAADQLCYFYPVLIVILGI